MLARKWKWIFAMCGLATLLYLHSGQNKLLQEYRRNMKEKIDFILEKANLPANTDIHKLLSKLDDQNPGQSSSNHGEKHSKFVTKNSTPSVLNQGGSKHSLDQDTGLNQAVVKHGLNQDVVFPSVSNCSQKEYNLKLKNHKGPTVPTKDVYPCKKWRYPSPNDLNWPVVVPPSKGAVLNSIDLKRVKPMVRDKVEAQFEVQLERLGRIKDTCDRYPHLAIRQHVTFVWDTKVVPPVVYCPLYKVASTTWMVYFLRLAHVNDDNPALEIYKFAGQEKKKYMPRFGGGHQRVFKEYKAPSTSFEKNKVFKKSLRFIVVRHPFTRLLSAYRDKIERPKPRPFSPYFKDLQQAIIKKYRHPERNISSITPTFSEFVDYIIDSTEHLKTPKDWEENVICWSPFWTQCGVCSTDYQVVIKLETMDDDEQFLAHIANLTEIQNVHEWRNLKRTSVSSSVVSPKYYGSLTKQQIEKLYERYKIDFELFGYTVDDYL